MIRIHALLALLISISFCDSTRAATGPALPFVANAGQWSDVVAFRAPIPGGVLYVARDGELLYVLPGFALTERIAGSGRSLPRGEAPAATRVNWIVGNGGSRAGIPAFERVNLGAIGERIEVALAARDGNVEKIFTVRPGGDPADIRVAFPEAVLAVGVTEEGRLRVDTQAGPVTFTRPAAWQDTPRGRRRVEVAYAVDQAGYGFEVGPYDRDLPLVIDPLLASTYAGGSADDDTYEPSCAVDAEGNVYLSGFTQSADYPLAPGGLDDSLSGVCDRFVARYDADLSTLVAATFIGGPGYEFGMGIAFDAAGDIYLAGYTNSGAGFPSVPGGYVTPVGGALDAFVVKLDADLSTLLAAARFGGANDEGFRWPRIDLAVGDTGDVYVAGITKSSDFPIVNGYDATYAGGGGLLQGGDVFVARFDADLTVLKASTFLGGANDEWRPSIALADGGDVLVCGDTMGGGFPTTPGCHDDTCNPASAYDADMFVSRFDAGLSNLLASTFYGSDREEDALALRVAPDGGVFVAGYTTSGSCPVTPGAYDTSYSGGARDAVVARFSGDLTELEAATFLGGGGSDTAEDIVLDGRGHIYVAGVTTWSTSPFPVNEADCFDATLNGGEDGFVSRLTLDLAALPASTLIGGSADDRVQGIALADDGVYICGRTGSPDFPTAGTPHQDAPAGGWDCFLGRFDADLSSDATAVAPARPREQGLLFEGSYPNPFNPRTKIRYTLAEPARVLIEIFDATGRRVAALPEGFRPAGSHEADWRAEDLPSGAYSLRILADGRQAAGRLMLLK